MQRRNARPKTRATSQKKPSTANAYRGVEDGLAALTGVGIGVALMYLFDPRQGSARRKRIADGAQSAFSSAGDSALHAMHSLTDASRNMVGSAVETAQEKAARLGEKLSDRAKDAADDTIAAKRDWVNRASLAIGRDRDHHPVGQTACAIGSAALGAGLLWMFDPKLGSARRAWLGHKVGYYTNETTDFLKRSTRYVGRLVMRGRDELSDDFDWERSEADTLQTHPREDMPPDREMSNDVSPLNGSDGIKGPATV